MHLTRCRGRGFGRGSWTGSQVWPTQPRHGCGNQRRTIFGTPTAKAHSIEAQEGVDQGCPLSPALFALGIASTLAHIDEQAKILDPRCRVFAFLDDIQVVAPPGVAIQVKDLVTRSLEGAGLVVNDDKTVVWTKDPASEIPQGLQPYRANRLRVLGCGMGYRDRDDVMNLVPIHDTVEAEQIVLRTREFCARLLALKKTGLSVKNCFSLLQTYAQGCVTHFQRGNYEADGWPAMVDNVVMGALDDILEGSRPGYLSSVAFTPCSDCPCSAYFSEKPIEAPILL